MEKLKMGKNESQDLRLTLKPGDSLYEPFLKIKESSGLKNNSELLRFILKQISKIPFSEIFKLELQSQEVPT